MDSGTGGSSDETKGSGSGKGSTEGETGGSERIPGIQTMESGTLGRRKNSGSETGAQAMESATRVANQSLGRDWDGGTGGQTMSPVYYDCPVYAVMNTSKGQVQVK